MKFEFSLEEVELLSVAVTEVLSDLEETEVSGMKLHELTKNQARVEQFGSLYDRLEGCLSQFSDDETEEEE